MTIINHMNAKRAASFATLAVIAACTIGCSGTPQHATWTKPVSTTNRAPSSTTNQALAAADSLGLIIFGSAPAVAEPKRPSHWMLAKATASQ